MSYTITTVSRRRFMVKAKKAGQKPSTPAPSPAGDSSSTPDATSSADSDFGSSRASAPELFLRTSYRRPLRPAPSPWWKNWLAVTLVNALVVCGVGGLYVWANGTDSDEGVYVPRRTMVRSPSTITTRPAQPSVAPLAKARQVAVDSSAVDEIDRALRDGSRKVILPTNVAGNCSIGDAGSKDFGRCLADNGARAQ